MFVELAGKLVQDAGSNKSNKDFTSESGCAAEAQENVEDGS